MNPADPIGNLTASKPLPCPAPEERNLYSLRQKNETSSGGATSNRENAIFMPLLAELVAFYVERYYKNFASPELFFDRVPVGLERVLKSQKARKEIFSDRSAAVYLVGHDSKTSLLAPRSLSGDASFHFVYESRGRRSRRRGTEDPWRLVRRILTAGDGAVIPIQPNADAPKRSPSSIAIALAALASLREIAARV